MKFSVKDLTWNIKTTGRNDSSRSRNKFTINQTLYMITKDDDCYSSLYLFDYNSGVDFEFATKLLYKYHELPLFEVYE